MGQDDQLVILRDQSRNLVERLRAAAMLDLEFWVEERMKPPPNLSREEFVRILPHIPLKVDVKWSRRKSNNGKYGLTGEDQVFSFEFEFIHGPYIHVFYVKGFFFEKTELRGVEIQSFRRERKIKRGLRLIRRN